ncbi:MAG: hypothetical protein EOP06_19220 [Proteobacteria bacterium]|nr:MAG: hypothetical protein EOP06_19220 [Pseudomonadota bacterium]
MRSRFLPSIMTAPLVVVCLTLVSFSASAISTADKIRDKYVDDVCDESTHMKVTNLSCVSCGMQKFLSHGKSSEQRKALTPSEKYLSLLGYATNRFTS